MPVLCRVPLVFPTPVGMNRSPSFATAFGLCVPHTRGDEPDGQPIPPCPPLVFPTPVGMNRVLVLVSLFIVRVPHTRGDEPTASGDRCNKMQCSPHPWG